MRYDYVEPFVSAPSKIPEELLKGPVSRSDLETLVFPLCTPMAEVVVNVAFATN